MTETIRQLWKIIDKRQKFYFLLLFVMNILGSFFELLAIGALVPFLAILIDPEKTQKLPFVKHVVIYFNDLERREFLLYMSVFIFVLFVVKSLLALFLEWCKIKFSVMIYRKSSLKLLEKYMTNPYIFHTQKNTTTLLHNINSIPEIIYHSTFSVLQIFHLGTILISLLLFLFWLDFTAFTILCISLGITTILFIRTTNSYLKKDGEVIYSSANKMNLLVQHGLGSIKETKILGREQYFLDNYYRTSLRHERSNASHYTLLLAPRYFLEMITVGVVLAMMMYMQYSGDTTQSIIVKISVFGVAAYRLLPSLINFIKCISSINFGTYQIGIMHRDLEESFPEKIPSADAAALPFAHSIVLENIDYSYPGSPEKILDAVSLTIKKNSTVGFVGATGVGKTTLVDIILGLLKMDSGEIKIDGVSIADKVFEWQKNLAYIPQEIFIADETIKRNIAFGIEEENIDEARIWHALRIAQLEEFVRNLPEGIHTVIGERGIRVSCGQRQRIGIARAFYRDPKVLIMDEATAALDNETEAELMKAIYALEGKITIIIIAHRLTTVKNCDEVFFLKNGKIIASGKYEELEECCEDFRRLASPG